MKQTKTPRIAPEKFFVTVFYGNAARHKRMLVTLQRKAQNRACYPHHRARVKPCKINRGCNGGELKQRKPRGFACRHRSRPEGCLSYARPISAFRPPLSLFLHELFRERSLDPWNLPLGNRRVRAQGQVDLRHNKAVTQGVGGPRVVNFIYDLPESSDSSRALLKAGHSATIGPPS